MSQFIYELPNHQPYLFPFNNPSFERVTGIIFQKFACRKVKAKSCTGNYKYFFLAMMSLNEFIRKSQIFIENPRIGHYSFFTPLDTMKRGLLFSVGGGDHQRLKNLKICEKKVFLMVIIAQ